jgi:hypothetical protein
MPLVSRMMVMPTAAPSVGAASPRAVSVVVGLPTRDEAATIGKVVAAVEEGLRRTGVRGRTVLVNADNGSRDGTPALFEAAAFGGRRLTVSTGTTGTGKGTNVFAIFHAALDLDAERVIVFDADVRSIEPGWVVQMLDAVAGDGPAMAVPVYRRNRYEGNTTNHIASPLLAAVLGVYVQQPIAGDFAFNRAVVERAVTWPLPESAQLYGIDVHLSGHAARERIRIEQVPLGCKIHNPGFPKILFMSQQVIDAALHVFARTGAARPVEAMPALPRCTVGPAVRPRSALVERALTKVRAYLRDRDHTVRELFPTVVSAPRTPDGLMTLDAAAWAGVLSDMLSALARGRAVEARDHLVALYLCRVQTYWEEIERLDDPAAIDALLDEQTAAVVAAVSKRELRFDTGPPMMFNPGFWAEEAR